MKVTKIKGIYIEAAQMIREPLGATYSELLALLGSPQEVQNFLCAVAYMIFDHTDAYPCLNQGDAEEGEYQGQPIVWDGNFELRNNAIIYSGYSGPGGYGKQTERIVREHDAIKWCSVRNLEVYTK